MRESEYMHYTKSKYISIICHVSCDNYIYIYNKQNRSISSVKINYCINLSNQLFFQINFDNNFIILKSYIRRNDNSYKE